MIPKELIRKIRRIEITTNRNVNDLFAGKYQSVFKGRGMEFEEVREYEPGDDVRTIDWNVSARMGRPFVKKYVEERQLTVMLLVDRSSSSTFGSTGQTKGDMAAELCAAIAFSAIKNNDRVGLMIFTSKVEKYVPPAKGSEHVLRVIREILFFKPSHPNTNVDAALQFLNRVQPRKCVVFLVSDFLDSGFERPLRVTMKRHDVIAVSTSDPLEKRLPSIGIVELEDAETGQRKLLDTSDPRVRQLYGAELPASNQTVTEEKKPFASFRNRRGLREQARLDRKRQEWMDFFRSNAIDAIDLENGQDYVKPLLQFFRKRASRQRL